MAEEDENLVVDLNKEEEDEKKPEEVKRDDEIKAQQAPEKPPPVPGPGQASLPRVPSPPLAPEVAMGDLERQVNAERQARARTIADNRRLAQERDQAVAFAQEAERRGVSTFELFFEHQIHSAQEQMDALGARQESAYNDGDWKTVSEINKRMSHLGGQLASFENQKNAATQERQRLLAQQQYQAQQQQYIAAQQAQAAAQQRAQAQQRPQLSNDPAERKMQLATRGRTPETQAFIRRHPELVRGDGSLMRGAIEAHEKALDAGHSVDTAGYFQHIESLIGNGSAPRADGGYAAPVARGNPLPANGMRADGTFVMTPKMRQLAEEQGVTPQEWARNYVRLIKEGRMTPIT